MADLVERHGFSLFLEKGQMGYGHAVRCCALVLLLVCTTRSVQAQAIIRGTLGTLTVPSEKTVVCATIPAVSPSGTRGTLVRLGAPLGIVRTIAVYRDSMSIIRQYLDRATVFASPDTVVAELVAIQFSRESDGTGNLAVSKSYRGDNHTTVAQQLSPGQIAAARDVIAWQDRVCAADHSRN